MCGLLAIITHAQGRPSVDAAAAQRMRDTLAHRGPDDAGLWSSSNAIFAHRRLSVIDPTPAGAQPMLTPDERFVLIYNGELYNDPELRGELGPRGFQARSHCDTETLLHTLSVWGIDAAPRLRGMYAFALLDTLEQTLLIGRDPLGIKPLYLHRRSHAGDAEVILASEPQAILAHPGVRAAPDIPAISAYLSSIRPITGNRTTFAGIESLRPGEWRLYNLRDPALPYQAFDFSHLPQRELAGDAAGLVRAALDESVRRHLRSDRPLCQLLSGGLDSSAVAHLARPRVDAMLTFCAGAQTDEPSDDFPSARLMAERLESKHIETVITREKFAHRWPALVRAQALPMSTPNEVAIHEVALALRARGQVVALSGEGADELLGGYGPPLDAAGAFVAEHPGATPADAARFHALSNQWSPLDVKHALLREQHAEAAEGDALLLAEYERTFESCRHACPDDEPLQAHLRFHRRINLPNLLRRLDSATMHASVEGRTPFADVEFAALAETLPMTDKFRPGNDPMRTKRALRLAFRGDLPEQIATRPKASFPMPFQPWIADHAQTLRGSPFAREFFTDAAIETVAADPAGLWQLAWPMMNVALWGDAWLA
ncbi:MAG: asparagine synthase (glutamine-hydrolyzing) [Planctomycetota bacterium]